MVKLRTTVCHVQARRSRAVTLPGQAMWLRTACGSLVTKRRSEQERRTDEDRRCDQEDVISELEWDPQIAAARAAAASAPGISTVESHLVVSP